MDGDDELGGLYQDLLKELVRATRRARGLVEDGGQHLLIAKGLERSGDHATAIAEQVRPMVTGAPLKGARRPIGEPLWPALELDRSLRGAPPASSACAEGCVYRR